MLQPHRKPHLQLGEFVRLVTGVFRVYQFGEEELFEIWTVSEHGRIGQRWSEEGHIVPGGHADLIPERAIIIKISHYNRSLKFTILMI